MEGYQVWQMNGMAIPKRIREAIQEYRRDMDVFRSIYRGMLRGGRGGRSDGRRPIHQISGVVYREIEKGVEPVSQTRLASQLQRGYRNERSGRVRWRGLKLRDLYENQGDKQGDSRKPILDLASADGHRRRADLHLPSSA